MDDVYDLYRTGSRLLNDGDFHAAAVPLRRARDLDEDNSASIHEALGRAYFGSQRFDEAAKEFAAVVEQSPTDDYALFCLGRCLQLLSRHAEALPPLTLASSLRPERDDYRRYRDRSRDRSDAA